MAETGLSGTDVALNTDVAIWKLNSDSADEFAANLSY
jgi:hypothetical protein